MSTYRITIRTLKGNFLCFKGVKDFQTEHGLIIFEDSLSNKIKRFAISNAEIEEETE